MEIPQQLASRNIVEITYAFEEQSGVLSLHRLSVTPQLDWRTYLLFLPVGTHSFRVDSILYTQEDIQEVDAHFKNGGCVKDCSCAACICLDHCACEKCVEEELDEEYAEFPEKPEIIESEMDGEYHVASENSHCPYCVYYKDSKKQNFLPLSDVIPCGNHAPGSICTNELNQEQEIRAMNSALEFQNSLHEEDYFNINAIKLTKEQVEAKCLRLCKGFSPDFVAEDANSDGIIEIDGDLDSALPIATDELSVNPSSVVQMFLEYIYDREYVVAFIRKNAQKLFPLGHKCRWLGESFYETFSVMFATQWSFKVTDRSVIQEEHEFAHARKSFETTWLWTQTELRRFITKNPKYDTDLQSFARCQLNSMVCRFMTPTLADKPLEYFDETVHNDIYTMLMTYLETFKWSELNNSCHHIRN